MKQFILTLMMSILLTGCTDAKKDDGNFRIVTTTSMITDLVKNVGGDKVSVTGLMGAGVDPHLYKASEGDVSKLSQADMILYNGLQLEGKLVEVFENMQRQKINTIAISDALDKKDLIGSTLFASNYDPHIWFAVENWEKATQFVADELSKALPEHREEFQANAKRYLGALKALKAELREEINTLPEEQRRLVTAHDAFNYFGRSFGFDVVGLQGISTATEAGVQDVQKTASYIIEHKVKAIFIESSVPKRTVEALQAAVNSKSHQVAIGGTLFSDALGNPGTPEGTYIGMFRYNVKTMVKSLK
ncbi:zinc ABC transporter substrate-binding protein [Chryseobacterium salipaludis]|uniref:metal ABC transporter solute-binding protein, Zn/Mn family n=1 Tax=Chryseobacterium TaxID=59732 RepID=UPI001FF29D84|nr:MULTISPECIES: zinc ABC transporter substrate-binding protein [Chryseobacterium]MCJ8498177.1 zinc ABC transporter substrate-binding protein [Chryseobacterium salipaludis]MCX3297575.1 zinc ABC transporter substrate-binding protein [Planobacterium sp. JC490]